jgi:RNA polymerase sigma-70 factor (ECF subfamily)
VYRVARRLTGSTADAEDLTQETYLRAFGAFGRFQVRTSLKAWLLTILRNINRNVTRDRARAIVVVDADAVEQCDDADLLSDTPEERLLRNAEMCDLREALDSLPPTLRQIVWLRDIEEASYAEIAQRLRVPIGTVMSRLSRARELLYRRITKKAGTGERRR